jgi:hypothetical protein
MRTNPEMKSLPADTPQRMVKIFKAQRDGASPEMRKVLDGLIAKWDGWHGTTFRFLHSDGYGGVKIQNWSELHSMCVLI